MKKITFTLITLTVLCLSAFSQTTYYWVGGLGPTSYTSTGNWNTALDGSGSSRSVAGAQPTDILIFDGSNVGGSVPTTGAVSATVSSQTCGQLKIQSGANIWLNRATTGSGAITISGDAGDDLVITAGSTLTLGGPSYNFDVSMVLGAAATGLINGTVYLSPLSASVHTRSFITVSTAGALVFDTGSSCYITDSTASSGFNASGQNSIVFKTGASLYYYSGRSPIGSGSTVQFVNFESGSNCYFRGSNVSYLDGTTNYTGSSWSNSKVFSNLFVENGATFKSDGAFYKIDNLTIDNGTTLILHSSGNSPVLGNLLVNGTLNYPAGSTNILVMAGNTPQMISGSGTITLPSFTVANYSDVTLDKVISVANTCNIVGKMNFGAAGQLAGTANFTSRVAGTAATITGNSVAGSYLITNITGTLSGNAGLSVSGTGLSAGTNVGAFSTSNAVISLSKPATSTVTGGSFSFSSDSATLITSNPNGWDPLTGSVVVAGTKAYQGGTNYTINAATTNPFGISATTTTAVTIGNLVLNAPVTTNYNSRISGTLTLAAGNLTIRPLDTVRILSGNDIAGAPFSASKYIITSESGADAGVLRIDNFTNAKLFPVGTANYYLPATLTPASAMDYAANVFEGVTTDGTPAAAPVSAAQKATVVDAVWNLGRVTGTGDCQVDLSWNEALEGSSFTSYTDGEIGIGHYNGADWGTASGTGNNTTNSATGLFNSFSPFIVSKTGSVLPLQLKNLYAAMKSVGVEIGWNVLNEDGILKYDVEKSADRIQFSITGTVAAASKTSYRFTDLAAFSEIVYYRLKITAVNGQVKYSDIIALRSGNTVDVNIWPNPVINSINISGLKNSSTIKIINTSGQTLSAERTNAASLSMDITTLRAGVYVLQIVSGKGSVSNARFIKN